MTRRRFSGLVLCLPALSVALLFLACGSRTGLLVPEDFEVQDAAGDQHVILRDAMPGPDADAGFDAPPEVGFDAPRDVQFRDVPAIDLCPDAGATLIYVLTGDNVLLSFYPPTLSFTQIGVISCPNEQGSLQGPFSMAVDRRGIAYSVFRDGNLFRIDTASAACEPTTFVPDQIGGGNPFSTFGMGFVANTGDAGETLFVAEANVTGMTVASRDSKGLASIDTTSYDLSFVGHFSMTIAGPELTGTSDGSLFAFYTNETGTGSHILQIDKTTANIIHDYPLQVGSPLDAYAFGFWGGDFWVFTGDPTLGTTTVTEFNPTTATETTATTYDDIIVGAGVSTCAPQ
jgi:hypothetical protein